MRDLTGAINEHGQVEDSQVGEMGARCTGMQDEEKWKSRESPIYTDRLKIVFLAVLGGPHNGGQDIVNHVYAVATRE